jgi:hypothetical protein
VVLVPTHAGAGAEGVGDLRLGPQRTERQHERPGHVHRAIRIGESKVCSGVSENRPVAVSNST